MEEIKIWKASISLFDHLDFTEYLNKLPVNWRHDVVKYVHEIDKKRSLLARLMLLNLLEKGSHKTNLTYNEWGKPSVKNAPYFNWSHSGDYVVFAWSESVEIGVDVEIKSAISIEDFKGTFSEEQWTEIAESDSPLENFYRYWTINEALIKALGMGLSFDLKSLSLIKNGKILANKEWFTLKEVKVASNYKSFLAYKDGNQEVSIVEKLFIL